MIKYEGVLLTLKKRMQMVKKDDYDSYDYLTWGYYDGLSIKTVNSFLEFHPSTLTKNKMNINLNQEFIDTYTIRAVVPPDYVELEKKGFNRHSITEKNKKRFLAVSLMNVSQRFVQEKESLNEMTKGVADALKNSAEQAGVFLQNLDCYLFWSIGYSDFVVLFLSDRLDQALRIITALRGQGEDCAVCSNCYTVCGFKMEDEMENNSEEEEIKLSLSINMQEGISGDQLAGMMEKMLPDNQKKPRKDKGFYNAFGGSDLIFYPQASIKEYMDLYKEGGILNPGNKIYRDYISSIRTSIHIANQTLICPVEAEPEKGIKKYELMEKRDLQKTKERFYDFCKRYEEFLRENKFPVRSQRALQIMLNNYINIIKSSHTFDVYRLIGKIIASMMECMDYYMKQNMDLDTKEECVRAMNIFRGKIGGFLADLIRSDRPFLEGHTLTHPSIGSATKLLFSYNVIIQELADEMAEMEINKTEEKLCFLVMSGGCDFTTAVDIFGFTDPSLEISKPILIEIPEMSLYDVCGTLFRMSHECMHYCGERHRRKRAEGIITAISNFIAYELFSFIENKEKRLITDACSFLEKERKLEAQQNINRIIQENRPDERKNLADQIKDRLMEGFFQNLLPDQEEIYYLDSLLNDVLSEESAASLFLKRPDPETSGAAIQNDVYKILLNYLEKVFGYILKELEKDKPTFHPYLFNKQELLYEKGKEDFYNKGLSKFIKSYFEGLMNNYVYGEKVAKEESRAHPKCTYTQLIEIVTTPLQEGFADCMAARALNMPPEDFVLSFIYENGNLDCALPFSTENSLRIGADLKVLYGIEVKIPDTLAVSIKNKIKKIHTDHKYKYVGSKILIERLNEILSYYSKIQDFGIGSVVESYLDICLQEIDRGRLQGIREIYKKCSYSDKQADIYNMLDVLMSKWQSLSKELGEEEK